MKKERIPDLISEIKEDLRLLDILVTDIRETADRIPKSRPGKRIYE
jgi:hypothetical protein